ncbi:hypothetical protein TNCV_2370661 [Trichonephila clavipes]|nr:hypothetical protein TNCV_2370661 [Trichonephila clavipes]
MGVKASTRYGRLDPKCPSASAFVWFERTQGPLMKVLSVTGWQLMKQLVVRVHFLRCGGLLDAWDCYGVVRTTIKVLSYSTTAAQENQRPCSEKTKVYDGTAKKCPVSYTAWIAFGFRLSERCPVPIDSDERRSTVHNKSLLLYLFRKRQFLAGLIKNSREELQNLKCSVE